MRRNSQRARAVLSAGAVALLATALTIYLTAGEPAPEPGSLLADRPAFPQLGAGEADDGRSTGWRIRHGTRTSARDCSLGNGAYRAWSPKGGVLADPVASQTVCSYKHELLARAVYKWQSLDGVAAQADWPNFESWSDTSPFTTNTKTLNLDADSPEPILPQEDSAESQLDPESQLHDEAERCGLRLKE